VNTVGSESTNTRSTRRCVPGAASCKLSALVCKTGSQVHSATRVRRFTSAQLPASNKFDGTLLRPQSACTHILLSQACPRLQCAGARNCAIPAHRSPGTLQRCVIVVDGLMTRHPWARHRSYGLAVRRPSTRVAAAAVGFTFFVMRTHVARTNIKRQQKACRRRRRRRRLQIAANIGAVLLCCSRCLLQCLCLPAAAVFCAQSARRTEITATTTTTEAAAESSRS
jgi:hypothetical protein